MKIDKLHALELSLTIGCRLDCLYCPQKLLLNKYYEKEKARKSKLEFEDFKIALDKVQAGATISFSGMSEPFHNERCADMICYAYEKGYKLSLLTTLVGMTEEDFHKIKDVKFESFVLHIPDKEGHSKFTVNDEYIKLLKMVQETIDIDYYSCHGSVDTSIEGIIDRNKYAGIELQNRAGNLVGSQYIESSHTEGRIICYHGSEAQIGGWTPVMFPDGTLVLCCMDYGMKHVLGNLLTQTWAEICEGEAYLKFIEGLDDDKVDLLCRKCAHASLVKELPSMQLRNAVLEMKRGNFGERGKLPLYVMQMLEKFEKAETVCVFGLGKLFRNHFFQEFWDEGLGGVSVFSDNNQKLQGTVIHGIKCVEPVELKAYSNIIVVVFVKEGEGIIAQMKEMGIADCILIEELFEVCNFLCREKFKKMTIYDK